MGDILADYIELETLAAELRITRRTAERYVYKTTPGLPVTKVGRRVLVHREDARQWLAARRIQRNAPRVNARPASRMLKSNLAQPHPLVAGAKAEPERWAPHPKADPKPTEADLAPTILKAEGAQVIFARYNSKRR